MRPLTPVGFNREGSNRFLASLGLDTYGWGLPRGRGYPQLLEPEGSILGAVMEKGYLPLSGSAPSQEYFQNLGEAR